MAQRDRRRRLFALAAELGVALGATGTHPWSDYREQKIIDTEHYRRVEEGLKYVAWRNNAFSLHVHVGVRGADRPDPPLGELERERGVLHDHVVVAERVPLLELHRAAVYVYRRARNDHGDAAIGRPARGSVRIQMLIIAF